MTAAIRMVDPGPESDRIRYESYCPVCTTHEGLFDTFDDPRLLELRDRHNAALHAGPRPSVVVDTVESLRGQVADLLGVLVAVDEMWGDPDEARRLLRKALARAGVL